MPSETIDDVNNESNRNSPNRILIVRLSSIGDVVRTLPALTSLRRQYPHAHIAWAVEDKAGSVLEGHPLLDEVIVFERKKIVDSLCHPTRLHRFPSLLLGFFRDLRRNRYDLVFDFHGILKSGLIARLSGSSKRVGFERGYEKEFNYLFTNVKVTPSNSRLPRVSRNLELVATVVSPENLTDEPVLGVTENHRAKARAFVTEKFGGSHPLVAVHPGTSREIKKWPVEAFSKLCDLIAESLGAMVILTWGPGEFDEVVQIRALSRTAPEIAMQTNGLLELAALFELCDLMVTVDNGPMHIGSAMRTPVVALFGPTDIKINAPHWQPNRIVTRSLACCPCDENCAFAQCMSDITPEEVYEKARELLSETRASLA